MSATSLGWRHLVNAYGVKACGVVDWGGGVFASCMPRVQLSVSECNAWPHLRCSTIGSCQSTATAKIVKRGWTVDRLFTVQVALYNNLTFTFLP